MTGREKCLKAALDIVTGSRDEKYGKPEKNYGRIANHWNAYLINRFHSNYTIPIIDDLSVALMMASMKLARIENDPYDKDSYIDACGYLACAYEIMFGDGDSDEEKEK